MPMKSPLSPSDIEVLLNCGAAEMRSCDNIQDAAKSIHMFKAAGMVEDKGLGWHTTPKGDAFIEALLNTPEPVQTWTVPARNV